MTVGPQLTNFWFVPLGPSEPKSSLTTWKEGPLDDDDEDESEDESETETKQEPAGDGGSLPAAGDGGSLPAVKVKEEEVDYEDDVAGTAPAVPGEEPVNDDVPSPAETPSKKRTNAEVGA